MSCLIDLFQSTIIPVDSVKAILKSVFKSNMINCKNIVDDEKQIVFFVKAADNLYWLSNIWNFHISQQYYKLEIMFYNQNQSDLLRAYNSRMKFELSLLIKAVNMQLDQNSCFFIESQSGVLKFSYILGYLDQLSIDRQFYIQIISRIFWIIRRYNEVILFLLPHINIKQLQQKEKTLHPYNRINKIKCLLKNTQNTRYNISGPFFDLLRAKSENKTYAYGLIQRIGALYMENIVAFQCSQVGLEDVDQYKINQKIFQKQLSQKIRHQKAKAPPLPPGQKDIDKILYGLLSIKPIRKDVTDISESEDQQNPSIEQIGSHCLVQTNKFTYYIADTIHSGTMSLQVKQTRPTGKKKQGQLVFKNCKSNNQASVNSFRNQLAFLKYVRDMSSPFVARYYLLVKQSWNEKDTIYMNKYQQNVFDLIEKRKTLTIKSKLELSYKIAKGLCFLYSKQVVHRDFKPHNIVVDSYLTPKIIDFGSCASHNKNKQIKSKFTPYDERLLKTKYFQISYSNLRKQYPQLLQKFTQRQYDKHPLFDIYSFGKLLNYIFFETVYLPIPQLLQNQPFSEVLENIMFLIQSCVKYDPDDRPCFGQITAFIGALNEIINMKSMLQKQDKQKQQKKGEDKFMNKQFNKK